MPPRRNNTPVNQTDLGVPQTIYLRQEPTSLMCGDYLKKNYWSMAKQLNKKFECSICLEEIDCEYGCERCFCILTCGHIYHLPCIIRCPQMSCPLCRSTPPP